MTTNPSEGDTVIPTKTSTTRPGERFPGTKIESLLARTESTPGARKRYLDSSSPKTEVPTKSPRRGDPFEIVEEIEEDLDENRLEKRAGEMCVINEQIKASPAETKSRPEVPRDKTSIRLNVRKRQDAKSQLPVFHRAGQSGVERRETHRPVQSAVPIRLLKRQSEDALDKSPRKSRFVNSSLQREPEDELTKKEPPPTQTDTIQPVIRQAQTHQQLPKRDEAVKLRKTIQWLEEGARRMREDLAATRAELHEERRAARLARRELDSAVKDAKTGEAARHLQVISELKARLARSPTRSGPETTSTTSKAEFLKEENHRRELSALRKRLAEAEATVHKLKANACDPHASNKRRKVEGVHGRRLEVEVEALRTANRKLEERMQVVVEAERKRAAELRIQHENHESQLSALQKTLRSDTIKMMDEIRSKTREIEKLEKLVTESSQTRRKLQTKEDDLMRKLRETERSHQIRLPPRVGEKISASTDHVDDTCSGDCDAAAEVERLRELSAEQQEVIEVLRQAVKEKERKLDQISNKKRKEEFYKQWLELEPVVEVEDEEEHEHGEGDSALSSAPSSLSPQPGGCGQWQQTGVTREAYEAVLLEVEELQTRLVEEQRELAHAKSQVRELEKALLQETRGSQNSRRALSDKLREAEDREAALVAEISELREQNELLEFRVLELEEAPGLRDTPDPADSGIVSPEPIHLYKDQLTKQKDRAVATVIPYNTYNSPVSPIPQKPPLSLQESGIFDEDDDEADVELASRGTQTDTPAGDLLQEVQRLHELRARIQERAVKVPVPIIDAKLSPVAEGVNDLADSGLTNPSYQERIRELEERLAAHEEAESKQQREKQLSKQREEDLLDENYRLTEKIYWFESIVRKSKVEDCSRSVEEEEQDSNSKTLKSEKLDSEEEREKKDKDKEEEEEEEEEVSSLGTTESESPDDVFEDCVHSPSALTEADDESMAIDQPEAECKECGKMRTEVIGRLEELVQAEMLSRQRIVDMERREAMYMRTLQAADERWVQAEQIHTDKLEELDARLELELSKNKTLARRAEALEEKLRELRSCQCVPREDYDDPDNGGNASTNPSHRQDFETTEGGIPPSRSLVNFSLDDRDVTAEMKVTKVLVPEITAELATEAKEEVMEEAAGVRGAEETAAEIREVALGKGEETVEGGEAAPEPVVTINETEPEKKMKPSLGFSVARQSNWWRLSSRGRGPCARISTSAISSCGCKRAAIIDTLIRTNPLALLGEFK